MGGNQCQIEFFLLQARHVKILVVQVYVPTEDADDAAKDTFYSQLQNEIDTTPLHDLLLIRDYNTQISGACGGLKQILDPHGSAMQTNDNGKSMVSFCAANNISIGNTFYQQKPFIKRPGC